jgi:hypothetical protein
MAGLSQVTNALVALIAQIAYPDGTSQPSITGQPVVVYPGWPVPATLTADLKAGKVHISVFPGTDRVIDSAISDWRTLIEPANTLTLAAAGQTVTVGGAISIPQNAALVVDEKAYVYGCHDGDTLTSVATALAALVAVDQAATSAGAVVTIPNARAISPRVGGQGTSIREVNRKEQAFQITVWANCFDSRDPLAEALDAELAGTIHLTLPDGMIATLRYRSSRQDDDGQKQGIYRRDLMYAVEFSTTQTRIDTQITVTTTNVTGGPSLDAQFPIKTIVE